MKSPIQLQKIKLLLLVFFGFALNTMQAQQKTSMSLHDAVAIALEKSDEVSLANAKKATRQYELQSVKNNRYPDLKVSGQYMRLTNADIKQGSVLEKPDDETAGTTDTKKEN